MATAYFYFFLFSIWFISTILVNYFIKKYRPSTTLVRHPPSPPALPIIGHLHLLGPVLSTSLQALSSRYGPLMQLRIGDSTCVVVSNAKLAKEILKTHELNFVYRPPFGSSDYDIYTGSSFVTAPYGVYWRFLKKLCMTRLLSTNQLNQFTNVRNEEMIKLLESLIKASDGGECCDMRMAIVSMTNNMICRMAMSTRCSENADVAVEIKELVDEIMELAGRAGVGEALGPLAKYDLFGYGRKAKKAMEKFDGLVEKIMKEHEEREILMKGCEREEKDLMDILLESYRDENAEVKLTRKDLKAFFLDIFVAGTDTLSWALQWALAELINHPQVLKKLREEIHSIVGSNRLIKESDVPNLPYLQAAVMETLRMYPPGPVIFRRCIEDCKINGYDLKANSRVLINVHAIMRDPDSWINPNEFIPEKFMVNHNVDSDNHAMEMKGQNFNYLPFGSGRRGCPGESLALTVMHATIGALVQCFDWKVKDGEKIDTKEGSGFSLTMAHPIMCYPITIFNPFIKN